MLRWSAFLLVLTIGSVHYQYPWLYQKLKHRTQVWLGSPQPSSVIYRWQDHDGYWKLSAKPPVNNIEFETINIRHDQQKIQITQTQ